MEEDQTGYIFVTAGGQKVFVISDNEMDAVSKMREAGFSFWVSRAFKKIRIIS